MRQVRRVKDYVRCVCGRLALRAASVQVGGAWLGPSCRKKARQ